MKAVSLKPTRKTLAWLVHLYTATGGVIGIFALLMAADGQVQLAFLLLMVTMLIDGTDGILARRVGVSRLLPQFSGAQLDDAIDLLTYGWIPIFIMGTQGYLPSPWWVAVPTVALLYAYSQTNMKTDDAFFLGFPSYWNVIALYMFWLQPAPAVAVAMVVIPAILTFIPTRYLYPSRNQILWRTSWTLAAIWFALLFYLLLQETPDRTLILLSLFFPIYYMVASFYVDFQLRRARADEAEADDDSLQSDPLPGR